MVAPADRRILQVHPSRLCNLECDHCSTMSGPGRRGGLDPDRLADAVRDAAGLGYDHLDISGGEPLLYPGLRSLIEAGHREGMTVGLTTNGTLPLTPRLRLALGSLEELTISVDGVPASHDARRGRAAFRRTNQTVVEAARSGLDWAAVFTLTRDNLPELDWVVRYAAAYDARAVHVRPLQVLGRAARGLAGQEPDEVDLAAALTVAHLLQRHTGVPVIVDASVAGDLTVRDCIRPVRRSLADAVPLLALLPDGDVLPMHPGMHPSLALGSIANGSLATLAHRWVADGHLERLDAVRTRCLTDLAAEDAPYVLSWPDHLATSSHAQAHALALLPA